LLIAKNRLEDMAKPLHVGASVGDKIKNMPASLLASLGDDRGADASAVSNWSASVSSLHRLHR
jgi:hypothetical protein